MKPRSWILLAALLASACADETIVLEPAEFGELCGEVGPVQILALDPDRPLASVANWGTIDERRILRVDYLGEGESPIEGVPALGEEEVWSVGPCGEEPLLLAAGSAHAILENNHPEAWSELLLVCDGATGQISAVDPTGVRPSNVVFETGNCAWERYIDDGVLTLVPHDEESAALVLLRWPEDPWTMTAEPVVVHDSFRMPTSLQSPQSTDEDFLLITTADELVAVSRLDGELTTIATDVHSFENDSSGRYIIWQGTELTNGDPDSPEGPISFLDRQTNEVTQLTEGALSQTSGRAPIDELDVFHLWIEAEQVERFYRLPSLESFDVPAHLSVFRAVDGTRILVADYLFWLATVADGYALLDTVTGELTPLVFDGAIVGSDEDSFFFLENVEPPVASREAGKLRRITWDGETGLLAQHATRSFLLTTDHRVVTPLAIGADWSGSLMLVDPATLDEQVIDEDVLAFLPKQVDLEIDGDPVILYGVVHPERQGVWLARLAP
jgi:hypothetical protein